MKKLCQLRLQDIYGRKPALFTECSANMYDEVNTKCNLPAQIDIEATEGMEYKFLCVTKGGGSANKTYLYQETKAILNPGTLVPVPG